MLLLLLLLSLNPVSCVSNQAMNIEWQRRAGNLFVLRGKVCRRRPYLHQPLLLLYQVLVPLILHPRHLIPLFSLLFRFSSKGSGRGGWTKKITLPRPTTKRKDKKKKMVSGIVMSVVSLVTYSLPFPTLPYKFLFPVQGIFLPLPLRVRMWMNQTPRRKKK